MGKLALYGGNPVFAKPLQPQWPQFDGRDERALLEVFRSGSWWRGGTIEGQAASACGRFERAFAAYHGAHAGLACCNGTIALELALRAVGVRAGDEVVVPALSFVVSASACLPLGAVPVFADCDPVTLQPDPAAIEAALSPRTAAIVIVHFGGYPADLDGIPRLARRHGLALIEDSAHGQGSQWRVRGVGTYGDYGTFSFQQFKGLTCGEGGLVLCRSRDHWHRAYRYHNLGRLEDQGLYDFHEPSSNYRLTDLQGALLNPQLARLKRQIPRKMRGAAYLSAAFRKLGGLEPLPDDPRITRRGYYYYLLQYDREAFAGMGRERLRQALAAEGVPLGQAYGRAIHQTPLFAAMKQPRRYAGAQYRKTRCPAAERAAAETVCTLLHPLLLSDRATLARIVEAVAKVKEHSAELAAPRAGATPAPPPGPTRARRR
ncbi:MAG: DegT/DnrJ/EryC1/StrS family aminotransferase, partial [Gemmatimonadota bacterium]